MTEPHCVDTLSEPSLGQVYSEVSPSVANDAYSWVSVGLFSRLIALSLSTAGQVYSEVVLV